MTNNAEQEMPPSTHAESLGDPDDFEYGDDRAVFVIEDGYGDRHWYVATNAGAALSAHLGLMGDDDEFGFTVKRVPHRDGISVSLETRGDAKDYPSTFCFIDGDGEFQPPRIRAYAGMWAAHLKAGQQICSSVF